MNDLPEIFSGHLRVLRFLKKLIFSLFLFSSRAYGFCPHTIVPPQDGGLILSIGITEISSEIYTASTQFLYNGSVTMSASGGTGPYTYTITLGSSIYHLNLGYFPSLGPGSYPITVTDATGQTLDTTITIGFVYPQPMVTLSSISDPTSCNSQDGSITLIGSGGTPPYQYSIDGGTTFTSNGNITGMSQGIYPLLVKDANNQLEEIGPNSSAPGLPGIVDLYCKTCSCIGNVSGSLFTCTNPWDLKVGSYSFSPLDSFSLDGIHYRQLLPNTVYNNVYYYDTSGYSPGLYLCYIKDGSTGALSITGVPIAKYCSVNIVAISTDASCKQNNGSITVTASNGSTPYSYTIDGINFQTSNIFSGLASGSYNVTVTDATGVSYSQGTTVFDKCPVIFLSKTDASCGQSNGTITVTGFKGSPPYTYSIDGTSFQNNNNFTGLGDGNHTITLKDALGFTSFASTVIGNNCLSLSIEVTNSTCSKNNGKITAAASNGTAPYVYSIDGINFQKGNDFNSLPSGIYNIVAKDAVGNFNNIGATIQDQPAPKITVSSIPASCTNQNGTLTIAAVNGTKPFQYSIDNGNTFQSNESFTGLDSGSYLIQLKDSNACVTDSIIDLIALPSPSFTLGSDTTICAGQTLELKGPDSLSYHFIWQDNSTGQTYIVKNQGLYTLQVTNLFGCLASSSIHVNFNVPAEFSFGADTILCGSKSVTLQIIPQIQASYLWNTGSTASSIMVNSPGFYSVIVNSNGCISGKSLNVEQRPEPAVNLGNDTSLCNGQSIVLNAFNNDADYFWQDGTISPTYDVRYPGLYSVKVSENGCDTIGMISVSFTSKPIIRLPGDSNLCFTDKLILDARFPNSAYLWQDGSTQPQFTVTQEGFYKVAVSNSCGSSEDSVYIKYENCACKFFLPNVFTPNGDGLNDLFTPKNKCIFSSYQLHIFNRWGQRVFSTNNGSLGWDGRFGNEPQPAGVYVWLLSYEDNLTGKMISKQGTVVLIR